jgi:hypothetical protein
MKKGNRKREEKKRKEKREGYYEYSPSYSCDRQKKLFCQTFL